MTGSGALAAELEVHRGEFRLELALRAEPGRPLALIGPNAAGKSSTIGTLAGLIALDGGRIELDGRVLADAAARVSVPTERRSIGVVFQDLLLFAHLSVRDNVAFSARLGMSRSRARKAAEPWLERFGLGALADRYPAQLSGGQRQRVALARTLAAEPALLLLDEPMAALDVEFRAQVRAELAGLLRGLSIPSIVVTHSRADVAALGDEVVVLEGGRVSQRGTLEALRAAPATAYVRRLVAGELE